MRRQLFNLLGLIALLAAVAVETVLLGDREERRNAEYGAAPETDGDAGDDLPEEDRPSAEGED